MGAGNGKGVCCARYWSGFLAGEGANDVSYLRDEEGSGRRMSVRLVHVFVLK